MQEVENSKTEIEFGKKTNYEIRGGNTINYTWRGGAANAKSRWAHVAPGNRLHQGRRWRQSCKPWAPRMSSNKVPTRKKSVYIKERRANLWHARSSCMRRVYKQTVGRKDGKFTVGEKDTDGQWFAANICLNWWKNWKLNIETIVLAADSFYRASDVTVIESNARVHR